MSEPQCIWQLQYLIYQIIYVLIIIIKHDEHNVIKLRLFSLFC